MPSAVELGCLFWRGAPGVPTRVVRSIDLFDKVHLSLDVYAIINLSPRLQHGACGVEVDQNRAESLLERATELGCIDIAPILHGRLVLQSAPMCTTAITERARLLFNKAFQDKSCSSLGLAELALLYQYGGPGIPRDALEVKKQLEPSHNMSSSNNDYSNDYRNDYRNDKRDEVIHRMGEIYYGNLLAFGGEGIGRNGTTAAIVLRPFALLSPQASALLAFLCECDSPQGLQTNKNAGAPALYARAARFLWGHVFHYTDCMSRAPIRGNAKFAWNLSCNLFTNYDYAG